MNNSAAKNREYTAYCKSRVKQWIIASIFAVIVVGLLVIVAVVGMVYFAIDNDRTMARDKVNMRTENGQMEADLRTQNYRLATTQQELRNLQNSYDFTNYRNLETEKTTLPPLREKYSKLLKESQSRKLPQNERVQINDLASSNILIAGTWKCNWTSSANHQDLAKTFLSSTLAFREGQVEWKTSGETRKGSYRITTGRPIDTIELSFPGSVIKAHIQIRDSMVLLFFNGTKPGELADITKGKDDYLLFFNRQNQ